MLTRIRNGVRAKFEEVPSSSTLKVRIAEILKDEGYIENFQHVDDGRQGSLKVRLKYQDDVPAITGVRRVSSPAPVYVRATGIPALNGTGSRFSRPPPGS
jgi:small subunit ribosomal protein S8